MEVTKIPSYKRNTTIIETDLGEEVVLLDPATRQMFSLNKTGRHIWRRLPESGLTATLKELIHTFEVKEAQAFQDLYQFTQQLSSNGLLEEVKEDLSFEILGCSFNGRALDHALREWLLENWFFLITITILCRSPLT